MSNQALELSRSLHGLCAQKLLLSTDQGKYRQQIVDTEVKMRETIAELFEHGWQYLIPPAVGPLSLSAIATFTQQSDLRAYLDVLSVVEPDVRPQPIEMLLDSFETVIVVLGKKATGKGTIGSILTEDYGFSGMPTSDWLRDIAESRGVPKPFQPGMLRELADELRNDFGGSVLVWLTLQEYFLKESKNITFDGLKSLLEFNKLVGRPNIHLVWVDSPDEIRLERIKRRDRPGDPKIIGELLEIDRLTFSESAKFKRLCQTTILNDMDDLGKLTQQIQNLMTELNIPVGKTKVISSDSV